MKTGLALATAWFLSLAVSFAQSDSITAEQAADHVGQTNTVRGVVMSTKFAAKAKGKPTFLDIDKVFPNSLFTVVIWGDDRSKFDDAPEKKFKGKTVRVTGKIIEYRGMPEIVVHDPKQIVIEEVPTDIK